MSKSYLSLILLAISMLGTLPLHAQSHEILSPDIRSLQVVAGDRWLSPPIIDLNGDESINISFDHLSHEYHRYTYRIEHCEADWSPSTSLFESDYIDGFYNGLTIDDAQESLNTAQLYTHYKLSIPNADCRLKMSGNYRLSIIDDNDTPHPVATVSFMVVDPHASISLDVTGNTDIDIRHAHQQVSAEARYSPSLVTNPERQLQAFIMQNNRPATLRRLPRPTSLRPDGAAWSHCPDMIFPATNEYRKFEVLDIHRSSLGIDRITFDEPDYHAWLWGDSPRPKYVYDEDANGAFYIRNSDNISNNTESEYVVCHFTYRTPSPYAGDVFLDGQWTYGALLPEYQMAYDWETKAYHGAVRLKMGYYSYQYLLRRPDGTVTTLPADGNYYETENSYTMLLYYRPLGGRTDLLYGAAYEK